MEQITIIKRDGTTIEAFSKEPFSTASSLSQSKALMSDDTVKLTLRTAQPYSFGKGDKIMVDGEEYKIRTQPERELQSDDDYVHNITFYGVMYDLMKCQFRNCDAYGNSTKAIFDLTYSLLDFAKVIIYNMNRDNPGEWLLNENNVPDKEPITISFSKNNCLQVLQDLCSEDKFDTEFRITQSNGVKTIHIGQFGSVVTPPSGSSYFEWGKGNGLFQLTEKKVDDKAIITRLWAEGGTKNIKSGYRDYSDRLQFPYPQRVNARAHTLSDGTVIAAGSQTIGISNDAQRYMEDTVMSAAMGVEEDTQTYDDIYPQRTGVVSALGASVYEFVDSSMDFDLNETDGSGNTKYLIADTSAKITFITGKLAGQELELSKYTHSTHTFQVKKYTDERGLSIPTADSEAFRIAIGDKYKITDINMPDSYVQTAEEDLWYKALDYFLQAKQARVNYELTFDRAYFLENMPQDSSTCIFKVGDYVPVKDTRFGIEKNIRIQKVSRNLLLEHDYSLTLSDTTAISVVSQTVINVIEHEKIIQSNNLRDLGKAKRGWRTTEELRNMVYDPDGYFDTDNIRPNSIDTNMLTVGSKSQQFVLTGVVLEANKGGLPNKFSASAGVLSHLTILEDSVVTWNMSATEVTLSDTGGYYVFAKCSKNGPSGVWHITQTQIKTEPTSDPNNYYFQVGIIGSLLSGFRDFTTTYGFTRINGNTITTGRIVTSDGGSYLDLDGNKFKIGDSSKSVSYNENGDGKLILKNVDIDSGAGDPVHLGVYRGAYNNSTIYYKNDEVSYTSDGETCTYRYINSQASSGHVPTNVTYWQVVAKGRQGSGGQTSYMHIKYAPVINPTDQQMSDNPDKFIGVCSDHTQTAPTTASSYTWAQFRGNDGSPGQPGEDGSPGQPGEDGRTSYLHIKYSNNGGLSFTENNGETPGTYMGVYTDFVEWDSNDPTAYTWALIEGAAGLGTEDSEIQPYYEYRYAKNGSRTSAPALDITAVNPSGWQTTQPSVGALEYLWQTVAKKRNLETQAIFHIPVRSGESGTLADTTGNGHTVTLGAGASVLSVGGRYAVNLSNNALATMVDLLPFGRNFTLCFWLRTNKTYFTWLLNGKWGRNYAEKTQVISANTWTHIALRFSEKGVMLFKDGVLTDSAALSEEIVGFSMYDDDMFGSAIYLSDIWLMSGATATTDIVRIKDGNTFSLVANWSTPIRITPYDGEDGASPASVPRGTYSADATVLYYGNSHRVDIVKYNGTYYVARIDAPGGEAGFNQLPTNVNYWNTFGAQFESIATGLLLAEQATIDNLIVRLLKTADTGRRIVAENNILSMFNASNLQKLKITGDSISVDAPTSEYPLQFVTFNNRHTETSGSGSGTLNHCLFTVASAGTPVSIPAISVVYMGDDAFITSMSATITLRDSNDNIIQTLATASRSGATNVSYAGGNYTLGAGNYKIVTSVNYVWDTGGQRLPMIFFGCSSASSGNVVVTSTAQQMTSIGANGITIHLGNSFSVIFALDNNSQPMVRLQGTNSSNQIIGLDVSSAGVRINRGSGWTAL